jgi:hypothetical protein
MHRQDKPNLITIWGADIPLRERAQWLRLKRKHDEFARGENVRIDYMRTNMREFLDELMLGEKTGRYSTYYDWWGCFQHGLGLSGLCAPLTAANGKGAVLMASSYNGFRYPWGSDELIENKVAWADVRVVYDGVEYSRQEKIGIVLKGYIKAEGLYPQIKVCYEQYDALNCGKCPKCNRSILGLAIEGIDPRKCGFPVEEKTFVRLKRDLVEHGVTPYNKAFWLDRQRRVPKDIELDVYDSKAFLEWFRSYDIPGNTRLDKLSWVRQLVLSKAYASLPRALRGAVLASHRDAIALGEAPFDLAYTARYVMRWRPKREVPPWEGTMEGDLVMTASAER